MAGLGKSFAASKLVNLTKYSHMILFGIIVVSINIYFLNLYSTIEKTRTVNDEQITKHIGPRIRHLVTNSFNRIKKPATLANPPKVTILLSSEARKLPLVNSSCTRRVQVTQDGVVIFRSILIKPKFGHARVLEAHLEFPSEEDEFFVLDKGFFTLYCRGNIVEIERQLLFADKDNTLMKWKAAMDVASPSQYLQIGGWQPFKDGHYFAIQRIEFANVHWTIIDLLDIFISSQSLGVQPENLNIILIDAHPKSSLDPFWTVLFQRRIKLNDKHFFTNSNGVVFENLIWRYPREKCPLLDINLKSSRHVQPFRSFVLGQFGISTSRHLRNCSQKKLNVLIILRRDYKSHPRNLAGVIDRKITNEAEVLREIKTSFIHANITAAQIDLWPLKAQLETIANTDILFGMHGAAHAFSIFMEPGGAVIEMFNDDLQSANWHMRKIATLSDHSYINWANSNRRAVNKVTKSTKIPKGVSSSLLEKAVESICSERSKFPTLRS